ncbi:glutathione S-transferase family protein [Polyangium mundeleinium]|uniref:Glutathione S-transferase family protein n=1 Tax=Polyangium mundeleinium TaxID=2995306 RepID=A0ABT5EQT5_9BACT|nr:glutathione S-transferase family protein [Polyangium mundeleinium]MDC0743066.1 glutathione S-transferase family protein [Polyangium mundeleinium]
MTITLYHHPFSRAAGTVWALEEVGVAYEIHQVDMPKGGHKTPAILALNPMGKLPILEDGDTVVTEAAAIALYLADRYAYGTLAPKVDTGERGTYLRWAAFAPAVIEPGAMAKAGGWEAKPGSAGWGTYEAMLDSMESAIANRTFILGETFSMADVIFGGTIRYMLRFDMLEKRPSFVAYAERLAQRPALQRAEARNAAIMKELGLAG